MDPEKLVTVLTFMHAHETAVIRGRLESEGIPCFIKDELSTQVYPFISEGELQVRESDVQRTIEILKETGHIKDEDLYPTKEWNFMTKILSKIPVIKKLL
ncbi:MAG: DUF2007 domain-containing protein [Candidatus Azobacteroides sp.]|nr:DUF2007 domain-containing protein [Candidatus Azobacteroides sp.]